MKLINIYGKYHILEVHNSSREWEYYIEADSCYCILGASEHPFVYVFGSETHFELEDLQALCRNGYFDPFMKQG